MALSAGLAANWTMTVSETAGGHLFGNPEASTRLTEYISYTCGHCATFAREGDTALKTIYVRSGDVSLEIRHLLRDPVDLTAAMLTHCGAADKFVHNHSTFMFRQSEWLPIAANSTPFQRERWSSPDRVAARRAIASDLGFYEIMAGRGYSQVEIDRCLADSAKEADLIQFSRTDAERLKLRVTPSFAINDEVLVGVHRWRELKVALDARISHETAEETAH